MKTIELKKVLIDMLKEHEFGVTDHGATAFNQDDDYPDFIHPVAEAVARNPESMGIILGGSGQGEAICANRVKGARAIVFYGPILAKGAVDVSGKQSTDPFEIVQLGRQHNNANIISLGFRFLTEDEAKFAVELLLSTKFSGDERHVRRIKKLDL